MCKKCLRMRLIFGAVGFVLGTASGAGLMYLYDRKKMKSDNDIICTLMDEINDIKKENWLRDREKEVYGLRTEDELKAEVEAVRETEEYKEHVSKYRVYVPHDDKPSLGELAEQAGIKMEIDHSKEEEDEEVEAWNDPENAEEEEAAEVLADYDGPSTPHQISEEEFMEDSIFDKDQFTYYIDDDTLCDIDDNVLNVDEYLGDFNAFMAAVREAQRKKEVLIYWRMPQIDEDVEIELKATSYSSYVLGIDPDDVGGFERRGGRRQVNDEDDD